jgi:acyl-CoA synthetase (AMP-forming)/AMP-acid ligase II
MNMIEMLAKNARMYPADTAIVEVRPSVQIRKEITWTGFYERVNRLANGLIDRGVTRKDKIFVMGKNSISWLEAFFGAMATGAWVVPLNFRFTDDDVRYCANVAEPAAFIVEEDYKERIAAIRKGLPTVRNFISMAPCDGMEEMETVITKASPEPPNIKIDYTDESALYFTSGTTGAPKPVLHRQMMLVGSAVNEAVNEQWSHEGSLLMMAPLYHLAIGHLLGCMLPGARSVLLVDKVTPKLILDTVASERVTTVFLLVPWAQDILEALDNGELKKEDYDLSCWQLYFLGAQPIPPSIVHRWKGHFPEMRVNVTYGLSEAGGPGIIHLGIGNERKIGAIGKPALLWDARVVDEQSVDVAPGEVGELLMRGPGVMKEYYKNPELTAATVRDGWLYTGDLAKMDEEGYIYIVDRKKDLVISGGENVYPVEVEAIMRKHPRVLDVAVIGTPDDRLGEIVTAVIQLTPGDPMAEEEMRAFCEEHLPRYKRPRRIIFDEVPRNPSGKIEKPRLRAKHGAK